MTEDDQKELHEFLEHLGDDVDVLKDIKARLARIEDGYKRFARVVLFGGLVIAVACTFAIVTSEHSIGRVKSAQDRALDASERADTATLQLKILIGQQANLIGKIEHVAKQAQENGRDTSRLQCHEINKVLSAIRIVIRSSPDGQTPAADEAVARFNSLDCRHLPNAKPVTP
jgi:hypothetical protein